MADDSFLSRWSRRKSESRRGEVPPPEPEALPVVAPAALEAKPVAAVPAEVEPAAPSEPPPTLADVESLTPEADFSRFVKSDVDPGVQRAALKKLFADPHFNVMDGLDVYIDDYNAPDPLPKSMLRQMVQSRMLGLFQESPPAPPAEAAQGGADPIHRADDGAPAAPPDATLPTETALDEDPDLRLQPHDAAGRGQPETGAGSHPGGEP